MPSPRRAPLATIAIDRGLIGIDGCAGSGKSTLAARLAAVTDGQVVSTDEFMSWTSHGTWAPADVERLARELLTPLAEGRAARYRPYDWERRAAGEPREIAPSRPVIVEGVYALHRDLRRAYAHTVWVACPRALRLERGLARDGEKARPLWEGWMALEDAYVADQRPDLAAESVVDGAPRLPHDPEREVVLLRGPGSIGSG